jgi:hypothetical protein
MTNLTVIQTSLDAEQGAARSRPRALIVARVARSASYSTLTGAATGELEPNRGQRITAPYVA